MLVVDANVIVEVMLERLGVQALGRARRAADRTVAAVERGPCGAQGGWSFALRSPVSWAKRRLGAWAQSMSSRVHPDSLIDEAWRIAKEYGWAKTYDAEYLALARLLNCRLVTFDGPLWRPTRHLGYVITPEELKPAPDPIPDEEPPTR